MAVLIAQIVFIASFLGVFLLIFQKIPVLVSLPEASQKKEGFLCHLRKKVEKISLFKHFSYDLFLQKVLTKIRILVLKIENFLLQILQKLKEISQKKKDEKEDKFWEEVKKEMKKPKKRKPT